MAQKRKNSSSTNNDSQECSEVEVEVENSELHDWEEYWDEQAQGKYWYNNISGIINHHLYCSLFIDYVYE